MKLYWIITERQKTMFGKRTGSVVARLESDHSAYVASAAGPTATLAKEALINQFGRMAANDQRAYLFCADSTVLIVSFAGDCWQYDIIGAERTNRSGCIMPSVTSYNDAKARAYEHADQSYGGVVKAL